VRNLCLAIESAFSRLRFEDSSEIKFGEELAVALQPFASKLADKPIQPPAEWNCARNHSVRPIAIPISGNNSGFNAAA
jgi:hypothetical protein